MKKFFQLLFCCILVSPITMAQKSDVKAQQILKGVSEKYKSYKSVQADFILLVESGQNNSKDQQTGTLFIKGNKYKLQINNQEIISDNNTVWTYLRDANEVQINSYESDDNTISPSQIFTLYEKNFLYAFAEEKTVAGKVIQFIDLTPNDKSKPYFKVRLAVDKNGKAVQGAVVFDKNGNRYTYEIKKLIPDPDIGDKFFSFDEKKYPGVEVVDLR